MVLPTDLNVWFVLKGKALKVQLAPDEDDDIDFNRETLDDHSSFSQVSERTEGPRVIGYQRGLF